MPSVASAKEGVIDVEIVLLATTRALVPSGTAGRWMAQEGQNRFIMSIFA
jgi:hypothetical protein